MLARSGLPARPLRSRSVRVRERSRLRRRRLFSRDLRGGAALKRSLFALLTLFGCAAPPAKKLVRVELPTELSERASALEVLPHIAELGRVTGRGAVALELDGNARYVRLTLPGACVRRVELRDPSAPIEVKLDPLFQLGPSERVVGLERDFTIAARPSCPEAEAAHVSFKIAAGAPLAGFGFDAASRVFSGRTAGMETSPGAAPGIVPISANAQEKLRTELRFEADLPGGDRFVRTLGVSAVARSSGLPVVGNDHPVLLGGDGWQLLNRPAGSRVELRRVGDLFELRPDAPGAYRLAAGAGRELAVYSGRYDQTPLDCGRAECHSEIAASAAKSPMTRALASDLGGCHALDHPECAVRCHTTGEPGTADGGFTETQRELDLGALPDDYDELPPALRRSGGVGCLACHGPSKIPAPDQRLSLLRNDICAVCHDAPPRYGHVAAFAASRMAHSDSSVTERQGDCARCHTSFGALGRRPPLDAAASASISCAVCHDVHAKHGNSNLEPAESLLRDLPLPPTLPHLPVSLKSGKSRVCVGCHAPSSNTLRPEASAAALVAGQGGLEPQTGLPLDLAPPHAASPAGCLACHDAGPSELTLGKSHAFRANPASCGQCHERTPARDPSLSARALKLLEKLDPKHSRGDAARPWHEGYQLLLPTPAQTRALRNVLLVLEDPAADVHHPAYARALLDATERLSEGVPP